MAAEHFKKEKGSLIGRKIYYSGDSRLSPSYYFCEEFVAAHDNFKHLVGCPPLHKLSDIPLGFLL